MRKHKTKAAPIWQRFNGRLHRFDNVEDMKRFQIQLANDKPAAEVNPVCGEVVDEAVPMTSAPIEIDGQDPS